VDPPSLPPTGSPRTDQPSKLPTGVPSHAPTRGPTFIPSVRPTLLPTNSPTEGLGACIKSRYIPWDELENTNRNAAAILTYDECSWDYPGGSPIEQISWTLLSSAQQQAAASLGYEEESWDCWQNHFSDYFWSELAEVGVQQCYLALGWSQASWDGFASEPDTGLLAYNELSNAQKDAATCLCYGQATWDFERLGPDFDGSFCGITAAPAPTPAPANRPCVAPTIFDIECVETRFTEWNSIGSSNQALAGNLGYRQRTWNDFARMNPVELVSFSSLNSTQQSAAQGLGFNEDSWECWNHHYADYSWSDLAETFVQDCWAALGYTQDLWDNGGQLAVDNLFYAQLNDDERWGAECVCYYQSIWDQDEMGFNFDASFCV